MDSLEIMNRLLIHLTLGKILNDLTKIFYVLLCEFYIIIAFSPDK